jgi:peptide/nickel transport system substrate-binding protein
MNKRFKGLAYVLCLAMLLNVGAIPSLAAANYQDTITIGVANDVTTLDPQGSNTDANMMAFLLTHQTIVDIDPDTGEIIPGLASSWTVSEDGCTFTFEVPEGVKFSDGTPFVIEDIKYTYERADKTSFT